MNRLKVERITDAITRALYGRSGIFFTIQTPVRAPTRIKGNRLRSKNNMFKSIVFHINTCIGTLNRLTKRKNQAAVPINLFLSKPIERK